MKVLSQNKPVMTNSRVQQRIIEIHGQYELIVKNRYYLSFSSFKQIEMIEVFLFGIVLGLIPITLARLFVAAYLQY